MENKQTTQRLSWRVDASPTGVPLFSFPWTRKKPALNSQLKIKSFITLQSLFQKSLICLFFFSPSQVDLDIFNSLFCLTYKYSLSGYHSLAISNAIYFQVEQYQDHWQLRLWGRGRRNWGEGHSWWLLSKECSKTYLES